jgi:hypothetical protein
MRLFASERAAPEGGQHALAAVTMFFIAPMVMTGRRPFPVAKSGSAITLAATVVLWLTRIDVSSSYWPLTEPK